MAGIMKKYLVLPLILLAFWKCSKNHLYYPDNVDTTQIISDFQLKSASNEDYQFFSDTRDRKVVILFFGYTHCPDICINVLENFSKTIRLLEDHELSKIRFLFISIDPQGDRPENLVSFMSKFDSRIVGLTGKPSEIDSIKKEFKISVFNLGAKEDEKLAHTANLFWINDKKKLVKVLPQNFSAKHLAEEIKFNLAKK